MIDRLAQTEDFQRSQRLAQWRANWNAPTANAPTANTQDAGAPSDASAARPVGPSDIAAASAMVASALPLPFAVASPTTLSGGAYAISATSASRAYHEDRN